MFVLLVDAGQVILAPEQQVAWIGTESRLSISYVSDAFSIHE
jgi:hypothetical protein